jgi:hypothetical protein
MVEQHVSEDLGTLAESIPHWSLNPFHSLCLNTLSFIFFVDSCEEVGIETHLGEKTSVGVGVTKGIDLPANSRLDTEFFENEVVTHLHVGDHVLVVGTSLIVH